MLRHLSLSILLVTAACSNSTTAVSSNTSGELTVSATDAPFSHAIVDEARIEVDLISLHSDGNASGGFTTIYRGVPMTLDLLNLRNGVVKNLVTVTLPTGTYEQVRLRVSGAYLKLINGNEYSTTDGSIKLSSQGTSGFKVFVSPGIEVKDAVSTELLLDFDLSKTFKPIPANDPLTATRFMLSPVIRATNRSTSGEIRGVVTEDDGAGGRRPVDMAPVYVLPPGITDPTLALATTATAPTGAYAILGIPAGVYDIRAELGGKVATTASVSVAVGAITVADVDLP